MRSFDDVASEVATLNSLISMLHPEENCIDRASLWSRMSVVLEKAIRDANRNLVRVLRTPPAGFSEESDPHRLWMTIDAERALEDLVKLIELAQANGVCWL